MLRPLPGLIAAALALVAGAAMAETKAELAARIVQLQQPALEAMARGIAGDTAQRVLQAAGQAMATVPQDKREALGKQVEADVKAFYADIEPKLREAASKSAPSTLGPLFEERFSEDELKQVAAWLGSSAAKKFQQLGGEMQTLISRKLVEDTRTVVEPKLKVLEQSLQQRFAAFPPSAASAPAKAAATPKAPAAAASSAKKP
jgi:uncharacterized protein